MNRIVILSFIAGILFSLQATAQTVPDKLTYCGIELTFTEGAKTKLRGYISSIYESPRYYNAIVDMADTYMPFIEEAFTDAGAPQDLKYIVIQESSLKADAVSSSNAVGFWQFKVGAASDYGLLVTDQVDERMHIFRASTASGNYFVKANNDFDNWVYAVIAYYEGLTGAVQYTDPQYYGANKMIVTDNLHWYVMKSIAHKIAYQDALAMERKPRLWLEPISTKNEISVRRLYESHDIPKETFLEYNKWIKDDSRLPKNSEFTYYIPRDNIEYTGHTSDPTKPITDVAIKNPVIDITEIDPGIPVNTEVTPDETEIVNPNPEFEGNSTVNTPPPFMPASGPVASSIENNPGLPHVQFRLIDDLEFGAEYIMYDGKQLTPEIANMFNKRLSSLLEWNHLIPGQEPQVGKIFYLQKPKKLKYHIVEEGENLDMIAALHYSTVEKIQKKNRMPKEYLNIYVGQKLYLKKKKPQSEKIILLDKGFKPVIKNKPVPIHSDPITPGTVDLGKVEDIPTENPNGPTPNPVSGQNGQDNNDGVSSPKTKWVEHTVVPGETLWSISVAYGTKVEIIKLTNKMSTDSLSEGMILKILANTGKLREMGRD